MRANQSFKKGFVGIKAIAKTPQREISSKLKIATLENINTSISNIKYCVENNIANYRISSNLIPFAEYFNWCEDKDILRELGNLRSYAKEGNISLTIHPDQFTILNSKKDEVVESSKQIINHHYKLAKLVGISAIILHTGGVYGDKDSSMLRFVENFNALSKEVQSLLCLENCHYFSYSDVALISSLCNIKTCYDLHHERVILGSKVSLAHHIDNIDALMPFICHISSGKNSLEDKSHSDYISSEDVKTIQSIFTLDRFRDLVIEVEAKAKDKAIARIIKECV